MNGRIAAFVGVLVSLTAIALSAMGAGKASARAVNPGDFVQYTWCGSGPVELEYWDSKGAPQDEFVNMRNGCRDYGYRATSSSTYVSTFITDDRGGRVMCVIRVNGLLVSRKQAQANGAYTFQYCH